MQWVSSILILLKLMAPMNVSPLLPQDVKSALNESVGRLSAWGSWHMGLSPGPGQNAQGIFEQKIPVRIPFWATLASRNRRKVLCVSQVFMRTVMVVPMLIRPDECNGFHRYWYYSYHLIFIDIPQGSLIINTPSWISHTGDINDCSGTPVHTMN